MRYLYRHNRKDIVYKYRPFEISADELRNRTEGTFLIFRDSLLEDCAKLGEFKDSALIYSIFKGYMREPRFRTVQKFLKEKGMPMEILHTSGHASFQDLKKFTDALKPAMLVPIHTFEPQMYVKLHSNVRPLPVAKHWRSVEASLKHSLFYPSPQSSSQKYVRRNVVAGDNF